MNCNFALCRDGIVTWIKKKIGPGVYNITTLDDAERILTSETKVVLGFLDSLVVSVFFLSNSFAYLLSIFYQTQFRSRAYSTFCNVNAYFNMV
jgi:hypothetical protein